MPIDGANQEHKAINMNGIETQFKDNEPNRIII